MQNETAHGGKIMSYSEPIDFTGKAWLSQTLEPSHISSNDLKGYS